MTTQKFATITTTTSMSSATLGPDSMVSYECDATAAEIGETYTFTDGGSPAKTFTITCKNTGGADVEVNWMTLSTDNDVFTAPPAVTASTEQSIGHVANGVIAIGVFSAQDGGTPAPQGTVSAADWSNKWMEKSERISGAKKLHEWVLPGLTHPLSGNMQNGDKAATYFFGSQHF